jgi:hypothetical protein
LSVGLVRGRTAVDMTVEIGRGNVSIWYLLRKDFCALVAFLIPKTDLPKRIRNLNKVRNVVNMKIAVS